MEGLHTVERKRSVKEQERSQGRRILAHHLASKLLMLLGSAEHFK